MIFIYLVLVGLIIAVVALIPVFKVVGEIYPYAYVNARLRSKSKALISKDVFEELIDRPYSDIIYYVEKSPYPSLSKFMKGDFSFGSVDKALRSELIRDLALVKRISPVAARKYLDVVLSKYDIQLIESLVRSTNTTSAQKEDFMHLSEVFSNDFLARKNIPFDALKNELKGTVYYPLVEKHSLSIKKKDFVEFERELDLLFFKRLLSASKSVAAKKYAKAVIDNHNLAMALKGEIPFVPGGIIKLSDYEALGEGKLQKLLQKKGISSNYESISQAEKNIQISFLKLGKSLFSKNPLSESTILGYVIMKTVNVRNLNILLKMKKEGFEADKIREVLAL